MRQIIISVFLLLISFTSYSDEIPAGLHEYISNLVTKTSTTLNDKNLSEAAKASKVRALMQDNLDFNWMANYTLGREYSKKLSEVEKKAYIKAYSKYLVKHYTNLVKDYKGQKPKIVRVRLLGTGRFMVSMIIQGDNPINVEYLVRNTSNENVFKVADIVTEGVSLISSQQQEFVNTLRNDGFNKLIQNLEARS